MKNPKHFYYGPVLMLLSLVLMQPAHAVEWSITELHLLYGNLDVPTFAGGGDSDYFVYTFQHADGWKYGDNFFFIDVLDARNSGFQDFDLYGEWYSNFSLSKVTGKKVDAGVISDIGFILGFNWARDADVKKYLPGIRLSLDIGGFAFTNLDITAYIDDSKGVSSGGAPKEDDSFMVDFNFARPFKISESNFSVEGQIEYIRKRDNEFGDKVESWILAQPQFRWNLNDQVSLGIEYQYWMNKLGDGVTDENAVQVLFLWKF